MADNEDDVADNWEDADTEVRMLGRNYGEGAFVSRFLDPNTSSMY